MAGEERGRLLRLVRGAAAPDAARPDALAGLARSAARGDRAAIRTFLVTVGPHLLRVVRRVLGAGHPDVDDVAQESAFAVMDALPEHRGECTVLSFACRVAALTAMQVRRREATQKRKALRDDGFELEDLVAASQSPDDELSARSSAAAVRRLLDTLPLEQAEVLALHYVLGFMVPEVAEASGVPFETVRSRLRLAKQALRARVLADPRLASAVEESS
ncbi:MAG TPA: RNA polymerase sigma factor [Polyangiaceae bacterium]|nr:RNA polymerase sigma factor [Polyangiaceae bacterium]